MSKLSRNTVLSRREQKYFDILRSRPRSGLQPTLPQSPRGTHPATPLAPASRLPSALPLLCPHPPSTALRCTVQYKAAGLSWGQMLTSCPFALWPWARHWPSLRLAFLPCKIGIILLISGKYRKMESDHLAFINT